MSGTNTDGSLEAPRHVSRLVAPGPRVVPGVGPSSGSMSARGGASGEVAATSRAVVTRRVDGDPEALGRLLAAVEPLRADEGATIITDAGVETVRFLAVLAVLEGRAPMPDYDLADPSLKWHAPAGVVAVPNPSRVVTAGEDLSDPAGSGGRTV